jgi:hypothetical protein
VFANEEAHQRRLQNTPAFRRSLRKEFLDYHTRRLRHHHREDPSVEEQIVGRIFQMPKTSRQSAKNIHLQVMRAMAICKAVQPKCGMFLTFTFNCQCAELKEWIGGSGYNPADYPDLCCRLATAKFKQLLSLLSGLNGLLGPVKAWIWSLEHQKRGNKHWHNIGVLLRAGDFARHSRL